MTTQKYIQLLKVFAISLFVFACGYKPVTWTPQGYRSIDIRPVQAGPGTYHFAARLKDLLIERTLAGSGLKPINSSSADLRLDSRVGDYRETVIATDEEGRTQRMQFSMVVSFELKNASGDLLWSLSEYRYSDQFQITNTTRAYRDEEVFVRDNALEAVAELVVTNLTLVLQRQSAPQSPPGDSP